MKALLSVDQKNALDYFFKLETDLLNNKNTSDFSDANDIILDFDSISLVLFNQIQEFIITNKVSNKIIFLIFFITD